VRALQERVRVLESAVGRIEASVAQTAEAQRLTTPLLASRGALRVRAPGE
jgi:hypothetical protein